MKEKFEKAETEIEEKFKDFDPKRLTEESDKIHEVKVKGIGKVKFKALTFNDIIEVEGLNIGIQEKGCRFIYLMLKKAYPDLSFDDVRKWDSNKVADITLAMSSAGFFRQGTMPPTMRG